MKIRIRFEKTGLARFISHLDMMRFWQRQVRIADIPIRYSEGFSKRQEMSFICASPLGLESLCEIMDIETEVDVCFDEIKEKINNNLPDGIKITSVYEPVNKFKNLYTADYDIRINSNNFENFLNQENIFIKKTNKKGITKSIDIKSDIKLIYLNDNLIRLNLPNGSAQNLNPFTVVNSFNEYLNEKRNFLILKTEIYTDDRKKFI